MTQEQQVVVAPDRYEMERRFQRFAMEESSDNRDPKTAPIVDFRVQDNTDFFGGLEITLYIHTGQNIYSHTFYHTKESPASCLVEILNGISGNSLDVVLDETFEIIPKEDEKWYNPKYDILFSQDSLPEDSSKRRFQDVKLFKKYNEKVRTYNEQKVEKTNGYAKMIDYDVRESAPEITQNLEIDIKFSLPNGETKWYKCLHDVEHPDEGFERLRNAAGNPENVYELMGVQIYTRWDDEKDRWLMFPPKKSLPLLYKLRVKVDLPKLFQLKFYPIEKTYKHADE